MDMKVKAKKLSGIIRAVPSKSDFHRILICASLCTTDTNVKVNGFNTKESLSEDIKATIRCLEAFGTKLQYKDDTITVESTDKNSVQGGYTLDCGESGSTLRFMLPVCAAFGKSFTVTGTGRLPSRPIGDLLDQMREHGCVIEDDKLPLKVSGKLYGGHYLLPGDISSQYVTGLLFALPVLEKDSLIELTTDLESKKYVDMTVDTLNKFDIHIGKGNREYMIQGDKIYRSPQNINVEGDWSNAAFWLAAGALSEDGITCCGLDMNSNQPDKEICELLIQIGADVTIINDEVTVRKKDLNGIIMDASKCPDLVPIMSVLMSVCRGDSKIINGQRLRIKESDRLASMGDNLTRLGAYVSERPDGLDIKGCDGLHGSQVEGYNDHRIVMAMAVASILSDNDVIINGSEAVNKSYKDFFKDFETLGGKADVI